MTTSPHARRSVVTALGNGKVELRSQAIRPTGLCEIAGPTLFTLISPGTELAISAMDRSHPISLGYAAVFQVDEIGPEVEDWSYGDLAFVMGPHASRQKATYTDAIRLDPSLDPASATFARIMNISLSALSVARPAVGAMVGVVGLGVVGQLAARVCTAAGFRTSATDRASERLALCRDGIAAASELPEGSLDPVLECTGHGSSVLSAAGALRVGGELNLVGVPWRSRDETQLHALMELVFHRYLTIRSGWEWQIPWEAAKGDSLPSMRAQLELALSWLADETVVVDDLASVISASEAPQAYDQLRRRRASRLTYLLSWS